MATCFVICAIGSKDTEIRQQADDLFEELETALEPFDITPMRGDHNIDTREIDSDIIEHIQNAELCIADISENNPNVYYELGRRDETGKPIILIKRRGSGELPVDISARRYIEYEIDSRRGAREFRNLLREAVQAQAKNGFVGTRGDATLSGVLQVIQRVERKLDRMSKDNRPAINPTPTQPGSLPSGLEPIEAFRLSLRTRNIPLGETAMDHLQWSMDKNHFYDIVVEQLASIGSRRAADMLFDYAQEFFDSNMNFKQKVEYLSVLVGCANRYDREFEIEDLVVSTAKMLNQQALTADPPVNPEDHVQVFNQCNRLYHGMYTSTEDVSYLRKAIQHLESALEIVEEPYLYYNLAICRRHIDLPGAREAIDRCLALDPEHPDDDHLELACRIYRDMGDPSYDDLFALLETVNPQKALLLSTSE